MNIDFFQQLFGFIVTWDGQKEGKINVFLCCPKRQKFNCLRTCFEGLFQPRQVRCWSTHSINTDFYHSTSFNLSNARSNYEWNVSFFTPILNESQLINLQFVISNYAYAYFNACWNLTPNNGPGLAAGTRHTWSSSLANLTIIFSVIVSESLSDFAIGTSSSHFRLS